MVAPNVESSTLAPFLFVIVYKVAVSPFFSTVPKSLFPICIPSKDDDIFLLSTFTLFVNVSETFEPLKNVVFTTSCKYGLLLFM